MNNGVYSTGPEWLPLLTWAYWFWLLRFRHHERKAGR